MTSNNLSKCSDCGYICPTEELVQTKTTYEQYYGVENIFPNSHTLYLCVCPKCGGEEVNSLIHNEDEEY